MPVFKTGAINHSAISPRWELSKQPLLYDAGSRRR